MSEEGESLFSDIFIASQWAMLLSEGDNLF